MLVISSFSHSINPFYFKWMSPSPILMSGMMPPGDTASVKCPPNPPPLRRPWNSLKRVSRYVIQQLARAKQFNSLKHFKTYFHVMQKKKKTIESRAGAEGRGGVNVSNFLHGGERGDLGERFCPESNADEAYAREWLSARRRVREASPLVLGQIEKWKGWEGEREREKKLSQYKAETHNSW